MGTENQYMFEFDAYTETTRTQFKLVACNFDEAIKTANTASSKSDGYQHYELHHVTEIVNGLTQTAG